MRKEYRFDYSRAKPNRFAEKMSKDVVGVVLEPDVAAVFKSSKAVNALLRSVIAAMPEPK
jgi:translation elongation factor EF-4